MTKSVDSVESKVSDNNAGKSQPDPFEAILKETATAGLGQSQAVERAVYSTQLQAERKLPGLSLDGLQSEKSGLGSGPVPLERANPTDVKHYLEGGKGDKGLPPIAKDFMQVGRNELKEKEANDARKPQVHVSQKAGDSAFPLGSEKNPYLTIQSALDRAPEGSVINVHAGPKPYNEHLSITRSDLVLSTDPKNPAVIDLENKGQAGHKAAIEVKSGVHDVDIKNFEIRNFSGDSSAIRVEGENISKINIVGNNIHSAKGAEAIGIYGKGADEKSKLSQINILSNDVHDLKLKELEAIPVNGNVDGFRVVGNSGRNLDNIFIDAIGGEGSSRDKSLDQARNGTIEFNYAKDISSRHNPSYNSFAAAAIYSDGAKNLSIRNNFISNADFGIEIGSEHKGLSSSNAEVTGNIVKDSHYVWLGRGGDEARPGGARDSYAKNNILIGNDKDEKQTHVVDFPLANNHSFKSSDLTSLLPEPIARLQNKASNRTEKSSTETSDLKVNVAAQRTEPQVKALEGSAPSKAVENNLVSPEDAMRIKFLQPRLPHDAKPIDFVKSSVEKCEQIAKDSPKFGAADTPALMGPSTITADFIEKDLIAVGSPYANKGMGKEFIDAAKLSGVNAAYIYAKFAYESSWGKNPNHSERTANNLKHFNFGNQKDHIAMAAHGGEIDKKFDITRPDGKAGTRADGVLALALHVKEMYGKSREEGGVDVKSPRELICHYAPDSENNGKAYTKFMVDKVNMWDKATRAERMANAEPQKVEPAKQVVEPVKVAEKEKSKIVEAAAIDKSKTVEISANDRVFKLPDSVSAKAHTGEGQGYYQPIKASIQELLGRKMSEGETRAAIAAARALRHENGAPMNRLNKNDMLLPTNKESAEMFVRNIGNGKFGHQVMSKENIEKFKLEINEKFSPVERPLQAVKAPEPAQKNVEPKRETKEPLPQISVEPRKSTERPAEEAPKKVEPLTRIQEEAAKKTEPLSSAKEKLSTPLAPLSDLEPDSNVKLHAGDLSLNAQIIAIAGGSALDGALVSSATNAQRSNKISEPAGLNKDLPVAVVPGMKAGSLGLLTHVDDKGQEHLVPFVAGSSSDAQYAKKAVLLNDVAARELGINGAQHAKSSNQIEIIMLKADSAQLPKDLQTLNNTVSDRLKEIASKPDVLEKAEKNLAGKEIPESAYIPKPDAEFGYRRTERTAEELSRIGEKFQAEAAKNHELAEGLKPGSKDAPAIVQAVLKEAQAEKSRLEREKTGYMQLHALLKSGTDASQLSDEFISKLPPVIGRDLAKAKYNRDVAQKNTDSAKNPFQTGFGLDVAQKTKFENAAKLAMSYVKTQEERALKNAAHLVLLSSDKKVLQDRIIADASDPKRAQELLQHRFAMKAVAAEMLAANPDLAAGGGKSGALQGLRVVVNGGHDPYHGSRTPGFGAYEWSKSKDNPKGMTEYDFNKESSAILGSLIEYSGGVPIYVHQDELYKSNPRTQSMGALAAAMEAPKADVMISNHMDDDNGIRPGTLTLVNSQSHRLGALINQAKGSIGVEPTKPLKEQSRGVQSHLRGLGVLNEILTTAPQDRAKLMNPRELAKLQLGLIVGMDRYFHPPSKSMLNAEIARDKQNGASWESFWSNKDSKSGRVIQSIPYPRMDK